MVRTSVCFVVGCILLLAVSAIADDAPSFDVNWYGYVKLDGSYDQNQTSHGNFAMWVKTRGFEADDEQFNMTANQTRLGLNLKGKNYGDTKVGAKVEFDLYGGVSGASVAENKAMLQLRHAYFTLQSGNFKLLAGQSWDLISPLNPSTLNYPVLWACGNIQYRRPQVSLWYTMKPNDQTSFTMAGGFFRTIGNDLTPTFTLSTGETTEGSDDGTDAGIPSFQGRLDVKRSFTSGGFVRFGASGLWGRLKSETNLGHSENYDSWAAAGHMQISFAGGFGLSGEVWTGSNIGSYLGGIANASTIDGLEASGGWASVWASLSKKVKLTTGFGIDDPKDDGLTYASAPGSIRAKNRGIFGNLKWNVVPKVTIGGEVSHWETTYLDGEKYSALRLQSSFVMNF